LALGAAYQDHDLVCAREDGMPWPPDAFSSAFVSLIRNSGVATVRFPDLRHTHATQLLRQGVHPKVVSERLGHSTVGITLDVYSHVLPGIQEEAAMRKSHCLTLEFHFGEEFLTSNTRNCRQSSSHSPLWRRL